MNTRKETETESKKFTKAEWTNLYELAIDAQDQLQEIERALAAEIHMVVKMRPSKLDEHLTDASFYANLDCRFGAPQLYRQHGGRMLPKPKLARVLRETRNDAVTRRMANHSKSWRIKPGFNFILGLTYGVRYQTDCPSNEGAGSPR